MYTFKDEPTRDASQLSMMPWNRILLYPEEISTTQYDRFLIHLHRKHTLGHGDIHSIEEIPHFVSSSKRYLKNHVWMNKNKYYNNRQNQTGCRNTKVQYVSVYIRNLPNKQWHCVSPALVCSKKFLTLVLTYFSRNNICLNISSLITPKLVKSTKRWDKICWY